MAVVVKLGEYVVPYLDYAVAVAHFLKVVLPYVVELAVLLAAVVVNLAARTARTAAMLPEVVRLAKLYYTLARNAYLVRPDVARLVVLLVNRDPQPLRRNFKHLCKVLPRPRYSLVLEVVAKGEVAEHFKVSAVARGLAYVLDVRRANALLAGGNTVARRFFYALKVLLKGRHACVYQQDRVVPLRYEREARKAQVSLALKEFKVALTQII